MSTKCVIREIRLEFCSLLGGFCVSDRTFPWKFHQPLVSTEAYSKLHNCPDQKALLSSASTTLSAELFHFVLCYSPQIKYLPDGKCLTINQNMFPRRKHEGVFYNLKKERSFLNLYIIFIKIFYTKDVSLLYL